MDKIEKLLQEIIQLERGGLGSEEEDTIREETIMEIIKIIKKYI